jgi:CRISPR/Cas system-associated exonuclease Cas4 (RecB family)
MHYKKNTFVKLVDYINMSYQRAKPYKPKQTEVYKVSRSKIELFTQCKRCFWLEARHRIKRPSSPPFNINKAIDELFKKEFDKYRRKQQPHPLMSSNGIEAVPYQHKDLDTWRANFTGISTLHGPTNLHVFGAVDDVWINTSQELIVVDYKATAKDKPVTQLNVEGGWQDMYRRQMEVYQWLLRKNGFKVSDTGYFVYATGTTDRPGFDNKVEFETNVFAHEGKDDWVEPTLLDMKQTLEGDIPPVGEAAMGGECEHCSYAKSRTKLTLEAIKTSKKS